MTNAAEPTSMRAPILSDGVTLSTSTLQLTADGRVVCSPTNNSQPTTTVALAGDASTRPSRFSCVRRRSVEQEESGQTSTLEAYILLALELGEPTEACEALDGYLGDLVDALEFGKTAKPSVKAARASQ